MSAEDGPSIVGHTKHFNIPLSHLEPDYIKKCSDVKELEKILKVLKGGDEGFYQHIETACEERISALNPNSRVLRKEARLSTKGDLEKGEWQKLDTDIDDWSSDMKYMDNTLKKPPQAVEVDEDEDLPPIRSGTITLTSDGAKSSKAEPKVNKRVKPREYSEWDKIDVDKELEKIDNPEKKSGPERTVVCGQEIPNISTTVDSKGLTEAEKLMKANREKDKGNEAFRASDFKEAILYYSRSISLQPTAASYNNRALAYLKSTEWPKAIADCNVVLKLEPGNIKALLRRGTGYKGNKQFTKAIEDLNLVLNMEPNNKRAKELLEEVQKLDQKEIDERKMKGRRMVIEEVGDIESDSEEDGIMEKPVNGMVNGQAETGSSETKSQKKVVIEEVRTKTGEDVKVNKDIWTTEDVADNTETEKSSGRASPQAAAAAVVSDTSVPDVKQSEPESMPQVTEPSVDLETKDNMINDQIENDATQQAEELLDHFKRPAYVQKTLSVAAAKLKADGNELFRNGQYGDACLKYEKLITMLESGEDQMYNLSLLYSNRAACYLKIGDLPAAVRDCSRSLQLIPHAVKPLIRRAGAYEHLERFDLAYIDFRHTLLLDSKVDQAHLGTKRCQDVLNAKDGPRWRDKIKLPQVSQWEVPEIFDENGVSLTPSPASNLPQPTLPAVSNTDTPPVTASNQAPPVAPSNQTSPSKPKGSEQQSQNEPPAKKADPVVKEVKKQPPAKKADPVVKEVKKELTAQEKFDKNKTEGNEFVKKGNFREAIICYTQCVDVKPDQTVSYTNRALCYLRLNQAADAEKDCSKALSLEADNIKALFRRGQARKMLKQHREALEDLKHLLELDPNNTAAKKEMDLVKDYWRQELNNMKKDMKSPVAKETKETKSKPAEKSRKKMVIEEVEDEEEAEVKPGGKSKVKTEVKPEVKSKVKPEVKTEVKSAKTKAHDKKSKQSSKPLITEVKSSTSDNPPAQPPSTKSDKKSNKRGKQKGSNIKETSSGFPMAAPSVPTASQTVPKLEKTTPYEFISAWNSLKSTESVQSYYEILKQIPPVDIPKVISNKLDGDMLNIISRCVAEHYLQNGEEDKSYQILKNLSTVPRFSTIAMFLSGKDKECVISVMTKLQSHTSSLYTAADVEKLRKTYIV